MDDGIFDERIAAGYDQAAAAMFEPSVLGPTVDRLAELAWLGEEAATGDQLGDGDGDGDGDGSRGRALELAVGTGRVALPLQARGLEVHGIEQSRAMVAELAAKPGAGGITVTIGDMATTRLETTFALVYLVYSTISNLLTQEAQVACFRNAAAHLEPGGRFLVEAGIPPLRRLPPGERFVPFEVTPRHVGIDEVDVVGQRLVSHHHWIDGDRVTSFDSAHRYAWPAELDLMAQLAGLDPESRWADWHRSPFTAESTHHVSVWQKPARGDGRSAAVPSPRPSG